MLKFKNKFKFGLSEKSPNSSSNSSPASSHKDTTPEKSPEPRKTLTSDLSDNISKLTLGDSEAGASATASPDVPHGQIHGTENVPTMETSNSNDSANPHTPSSPGLLTVKIYTSNNIQLPIKINNSKQILHALAINSNNETIGQQLLKNLETLNNAEGDNHPLVGDLLPGTIASNFLPSIITIPNAENLVKSLLYLTIEFDNNVLVIEPQKGTVNRSTWNQVVSFDVTKKSQETTNGGDNETGSSFLNLNLFIRLPNMLIPDSEKVTKKHLFTNSGSQPQSPGKSNASANSGSAPANIGDLLIGTIKLPLNLKYHSQPIRLMNHEYLKFSNYNANLQDLISTEMGEIMLTIEFKPITKKHLAITDFDLLKVIGKGSFGKVMQVVKKDTKQIYALKTLRKQHIVSRMEVTHTLAERTVLARINNPFIVPLKFSFQSPEKLYLVLSFINGGELFWHLQREGKFSMDRSRFYIAELLTALESLHDLNVIYRDLKPENILLDYQGHIALCDFGLCKLNMSNDDKTNTFCGTPEYLAPELLLNQGYTRSVDWWTLGTLLYEMLTGLPPFYDDDVPTMYKKILQDPLRFPSFLDHTDAQDLLIKLLQKDPANRLDDANEIKSHPFFKDIDWVKLLNKSYLPPFKPNVENLLDTSNFDQDFTSEKPQDSVVDDFLTESVQKQFGGWTYNGDNVL
ncbi:uncharacterized protein SPAPADRAFT_142096 [Spathaspora passalidarum NRRL Y-27907]|uniref:non-specific serine/threonine protein kinase n=1 Tax=Spathaspora passalidarum (strain NRRL Y-27907 / 11-Y1) TaxID=619300 RepID=G3ATE8_SPAPN|nr:uncharacterized protein SPAPADRAFT_142096 [Spathaspora passalidarum NRRL Y-27907]EGW30911.1 hypothetical protein SPAPADRAFT_142096 [Spathaspora passalidarum NRRL Y-27907]